jgi:hypothetical protein
MRGGWAQSVDVFTAALEEVWSERPGATIEGREGRDGGNDGAWAV